MQSTKVHIQNRVRQVIEVRHELSNLDELVQAVDDFYRQSDVPLTSSYLKQNLRTDLECRNVEIAKECLQSMEKHLIDIGDMKEMVHSLTQSCDEAVQHLDNTQTLTQKYLNETKALKDRRNTLTNDLDRMADFLLKYQLTDDELNILKFADVGNDSTRFFTAFSRVGVIKEDCHQLVGSGDANGAELFQIVSLQHEAADKRLYEWTLNECQKLEQDAYHRGTTLRQAFMALRRHRHCKNSAIQARRTRLVRQFVAALTRGGPNRKPPPIEMHAHDPILYSGDMLAWIYQTFESEKQVIESIFQDDELLYGFLDEEALDSISEEDKTRSILGKVYDGLSRPLQVRIKQILASQQGSVEAFKLAQMLLFYDMKFKSALGRCDLVDVVQECRSMAISSFKNQLIAEVHGLTHESDVYTTADLSSSHETMEKIHRMVELIEISRSSSMVPEDQSECTADFIVDTIVPPLLEMCRKSAQELDDTDAAVYLMNNVTSVQISLRRYSLFDEWDKRLEAARETYLKQLVEAQTKSVLERCSVQKILHQIEHYKDKPDQLASSIRGLEATSISAIMHNFCNALGALVFPQYDRLSDPARREEARRQTVEALAQVHLTLYDFISDPKHGYGTTTAGLISRTPADIRTLLEMD